MRIVLSTDKSMRLAVRRWWVESFDHQDGPREKKEGEITQQKVPPTVQFSLDGPESVGGESKNRGALGRTGLRSGAGVLPCLAAPRAHLYHPTQSPSPWLAGEVAITIHHNLYNGRHHSETRRCKDTSSEGTVVEEHLSTNEWR